MILTMFLVEVALALLRRPAQLVFNLTFCDTTPKVQISKFVNNRSALAHGRSLKTVSSRLIRKEFEQHLKLIQ